MAQVFKDMKKATQALQTGGTGFLRAVFVDSDGATLAASAVDFFGADGTSVHELAFKRRTERQVEQENTVVFADDQIQIGTIYGNKEFRLAGMFIGNHAVKSYDDVAQSWTTITKTDGIITVTDTGHGLKAGQFVEIKATTPNANFDMSVAKILDVPTADTFRVVKPGSDQTTVAGAYRKCIWMNLEDLLKAGDQGIRMKIAHYEKLDVASADPVYKKIVYWAGRFVPNFSIVNEPNVVRDLEWLFIPERMSHESAANEALVHPDHGAFYREMYVSSVQALASETFELQTEI